MDFILRRGQDFQESFDFKNAEGELIGLPRARYSVVLERGSYAKEYIEGKGLSLTRNSIIWSLSGKETANFAYNTLYYTLFMDDRELTRGVLKVQ